MIIKMKNNILVDNISLFDEILSLEDKNISKIEVNGKCKLNIFDLDIDKLNIIVNDDSSLDINYFNNINNRECLIDIEVKNRSKCILNYSYISKDKYDLKIKTDFLGEEASILINVSALNDGGNTNIDVDGYVKTERINNYLDENNMASIDWNALNADAEGRKKNAQELADYAIKTSEGKDIVVLLMHDTYGKEETAKALPTIIKYFKDNGYEFKTLS